MLHRLGTALRRRWRQVRTSTERGLSMIEVLVSMTISGIVLVGATYLIIDGLQTRTKVQTLSDASNLAQLLASDLDRGLQNATAFRVDHGTGTGDLLLRARTAEVRIVPTGTVQGSAYDWYCRAWYYRASDRSLFAYWSPKNTAGVVAMPAANYDFADWIRLGTNVLAPPNVDYIFEPDGAFGLETGLVTVDMLVEVGATQLPVMLRSTYDLGRVSYADEELERVPESCW